MKKPPLNTLPPLYPLPTAAEAVGKSPAPPGQGDLSTASSGKIFRSAYSPKHRYSITFPEQGRTKQAFREECDINIIMARYIKTGVLDHTRAAVAQYLDVTGFEFEAAHQLVAGAKSMFFQLPSAIRTQFDNDPGKFLEFMENPANAAKATEMGLLKAEPASGYPPTDAPAGAAPAAATQAGGASKAGGDTPPPQPAAGKAA